MLMGDDCRIVGRGHAFLTKLWHPQAPVFRRGDKDAADRPYRIPWDRLALSCACIRYISVV